MSTILDIPNKYREIVKSLVGPTLELRWWSTENKAFNYKTPLQQWDEDTEVVVKYLYSFCNYLI